MIYGIGTDIFDVRRMKRAMDQDSGFLESVFTSDEIAYCIRLKNGHQNFAARFSAKEAFLKALGIGWRNGISFREIEIFNDEMGKPNIRLTGTSREIAEANGISAIHVSLSHSADYATAYVILEKE